MAREPHGANIIDQRQSNRTGHVDYLGDAENAGGHLGVTNVALDGGDTQGLNLRPGVSVDRCDSLELDDVTNRRTSRVTLCSSQQSRH